MKKLLLLTLGALLTLSSFARDITYEYKGQTLTYTVLDENAKTLETKAGTWDTSGNNVSGELIIPAEVTDGEEIFEVTKIGDFAFVYLSDLTSVSIPESVTEIGAYAFRKCSGLKKAEFASIESLCKISFGSMYANPLSAAHHLYVDGEEVFDVIIPEWVSEINYTFEGCSGLISISIPESATSIGASAFSGCSGLTSISIPESVTSIGEQAFYGCSGLTSISIPEKVIFIGDYAFTECSGLTSISIPKNITSIGNRAFLECYALKKAEFASIESLCKIRFGGLYANPLSEAHHLYINGEEVFDVIIPEWVSEINYTFEGFTGLTSISIPESVTSIGAGAFSGCTGLTSISIPESVTSIGADAFLGCTGLTSISIPESVTKFGESAFAYCRGLTSVSIPKGVNAISNCAFDGCNYLTSVSIPESVTSIGADAFRYCFRLTSISIPASVTSIGKSAFQYCDRLKKAEFASIELLCKLSFGDSEANPLYYAPHLYINGEEVFDVIIPDGVKGIGNYAFFGNIDLTSISIPESVTEIGNYAFYTWNGLTSVYYAADKPIEGNTNIFSKETYEKATLYMTEEGVKASSNTYPWYAFKNIKEFNPAGIEEISEDLDQDMPCEIYNLTGMKVGDTPDTLAPGIYIIRQGTTVRKVQIK